MHYIHLTRLALTFLLFCVACLCHAQSRKKINQYDIKAVTELVTRNVDGKEITYTDFYQKFDKHGNVLEEINYDKVGRIKEKIIRKYNQMEDKTEEITYDAANQLIGREVYKYDELGDKSEELKYDSKNTLISRSVFKYDRRGLKIEKKTYDATGNLIQVKKYKYDD